MFHRKTAVHVADFLPDYRDVGVSVGPGLQAGRIRIKTRPRMAAELASIFPRVADAPL